MTDYERIAKIIRYLDESRFEQPDLAALAEQAGLSEFHFHRSNSRVTTIRRLRSARSFAALLFRFVCGGPCFTFPKGRWSATDKSLRPCAVVMQHERLARPLLQIDWRI